MALDRRPAFTRDLDLRACEAPSPFSDKPFVQSGSRRPTNAFRDRFGGSPPWA
jgi:hypothetical protein